MKTSVIEVRGMLAASSAYGVEKRIRKGRARQARGRPGSSALIRAGDSRNPTVARRR